MADRTANEETVSREQAADMLQEVARELRSGGSADVTVGNKLLTLSPAPEVDYEIEVEERSPMIGGDREEVTVSLGWKPVGESGPDPDSDSDSDSDPDADTEI